MIKEERIRRIERALERYFESLREGKRRQRRYVRHRSYFRTSELELPGKHGEQKGFIFLDVDKRERKPPASDAGMYLENNRSGRTRLLRPSPVQIKIGLRLEDKKR